MEFFKELYEAWISRTRSHLFGSIVIAFVAINWKALFFLVFADVRAVTKLNFFDAHTDEWKLYFGPVLVGLAISVGLPYANAGVHWLVSWPVNRIRERDDELAHQRLKKKNEQAEERSREKERRARELVQRAQLDQEIDDTIEDADKRDQLKSEISSLRTETSSEVEAENLAKTWPDAPRIAETMPPFDRIVLQVLDARRWNGRYRNENFFDRLPIEVQKEVADLFDSSVPGIVNLNRASIEFDSSIPRLMQQELVEQDSYATMPKDLYYSKITSKGYAVLDELGPINLKV